jgi:hypothetical protein
MRGEATIEGGGEEATIGGEDKNARRGHNTGKPMCTVAERAAAVSCVGVCVEMFE